LTLEDGTDMLSCNQQPINGVDLIYLPIKGFAFSIFRIVHEGRTAVFVLPEGHFINKQAPQSQYKLS
jgi:hypothetical protein